jgi:hypothetical protein
MSEPEFIGLNSYFKNPENPFKPEAYQPSVEIL